MTFSTLPNIYSQDRSLWTDVFVGARSNTRRLAMLGDSQETDIGGNGSVYVPRFDYEWFTRTGIITESSFDGRVLNHSTGTPYGKLLCAGAASGTAVTAVPSTYLLPGMNSRKSVAGQANVLYTLDYNSTYINPDNALAGVSLWDQTTTLEVDLFAYTNSTGPAELSWFSRNNTSLSFFGTLVESGDTSGMSLTGSDDLMVKATISVAQDAGKFSNIVVKGLSDASDAEIAGARFRQAGVSGGISTTSFSAGGYTAISLLSNHANAGQSMAAVGPFDAVVIQYGANEADDNVTAAQFKTNVETIISTLRGASWLNNANQPFILIPDNYRTGLTAGQEVEYDQYPEKLYEIAQADDKVLFVNSRKLTDEQGLDAAGQGDWLSDGIHFNATGATRLASIQVDAMWSYALGQPIRRIKYGVGLGLGLGL